MSAGTVMALTRICRWAARRAAVYLIRFDASIKVEINPHASGSITASQAIAISTGEVRWSESPAGC